LFWEHVRDQLNQLEALEILTDSTRGRAACLSTGAPIGAASGAGAGLATDKVARAAMAAAIVNFILNQLNDLRIDVRRKIPGNRHDGRKNILGARNRQLYMLPKNGCLSMQ